MQDRILSVFVPVSSTSVANREESRFLAVQSTAVASRLDANASRVAFFWLLLS